MEAPNSPGLQSEHETEPAAAYLPIAQVEHTAPPAAGCSEPAGQLMQLFVVRLENLPLWQFTQEDWPVLLGFSVPGKHGMQTEAPELEKVCAGHATHETALSNGA